MLLDNNTHPERDIYYLGSVLLSVLEASENDKVDFFDTFEKFKEVEDVSMSLYGLTLDWLFLLGAVKFDRKYIKKCF